MFRRWRPRQREATCIFHYLLLFQQLCGTMSKRQGPKNNCWGTFQQQDSPSSYENPAPPPSSWSLLGSGGFTVCFSFRYSRLRTASARICLVGSVHNFNPVTVIVSVKTSPLDTHTHKHASSVRHDLLPDFTCTCQLQIKPPPPPLFFSSPPPTRSFHLCYRWLRHSLEL